MRCKNCDRDSAKYVQRTQGRGHKYNIEGNIKLKKRTNFTAKCRRCGWEGIIKTR